MTGAWLDRLRVHALALVRRASVEDELDEEMRYHLEREVERHVAAGLSPADARAAARRAFGNPAYLAEEVRDTWGLRWLEHLAQDVRFAMRGFRRAPSYVATVVLTIALGLGLITTVFTVFDAYVLRPLMVRDPGSLYEVLFHGGGGPNRRLTWREYQDVAALPISSESFAFAISITRAGPQPLVGISLTGDAMRVLGAPVMLGRTLMTDDAALPAGEPVVVLSYDGWLSKFGGDSAIVGKRVLVRGTPLTIVGVTAKGFTGIGVVPPDFWAPVTLISRLQDAPDLTAEHAPQLLHPVLRLRPGVSEGQARAALETWVANVNAGQPDSTRRLSVELAPAGSALPLTPEILAMFLPAAVAFGLVLLIACANVANVMLARGVARQREIGIRLAMGAARARLVRQLLTESVLLALPAAAAGFVVSRWTLDLGVRALFATAPPGMASVMRIVPLAPDARVFAFVLLAAVASALLFGLAPALQATRPSIVQASRGDFDTAFRPGRARAALVVAQITVCSLLLIVMGILLRGASDVTRIDPGIRTEGVVQLVLDDRSRAATLPRLHDRPDVRGVGASSWAVLDGIYPTVAVRPADSAITVAYFSFVDSGFFGVLDIPIRRGRSFTSGEAEAQAPVVVVSEAAAARLWPGRDPLGQLLRLAAEPPARSRLAAVRTARVIGVAGNVSSGWIGISRASPAVYYPGSAASANMRIVARVTGPGARERIDRALSLADPGAVVEIRAMADYIQLQTWPFRAIAWVATALGVIALVLTVIGIHGVLSYLIAQRTKEIGIRMALGAGVNSVVGLVVRQCARHALIGIGAGALLAVVVSRLFGSFLEIVDALDPRAYALGIAIVLAGAVIAAWSPARRAARVNPVDALRAD